MSSKIKDSPTSQIKKIAKQAIAIHAMSVNAMSSRLVQIECEAAWSAGLFPTSIFDDIIHEPLSRTFLKKRVCYLSASIDYYLFKV